MDWKYYIMHEWPDGQRRLWGELFLLPDDPSYEGKAVWLIVKSGKTVAEYRALRKLNQHLKA